MGILLAFFACWTTCAKACTQSHDEVVAALKAVRDSEEVAELVVALRSHAGFALKELGTRRWTRATAARSASRTC